MTDDIYCSIILTLQECHAIGAALIDYGSKKLGVKFPPEITHGDILEDFNCLKKSKRLEIYMDCMEEIKRGMHKAILDARLEEMGHKDSRENMK